MLINKYIKKNILLETFPRKINDFFRKINKSPQYILVFIFGRFHAIRFIYVMQANLFHKSEKALKQNNFLSLFPELDTQKIVESLEQDGIAEDISLPQETLQEILEYAYSQNCFADGRTDLGFNILDKNKIQQSLGYSFYVARYFNVSNFCFAISRLSQDWKLQEIARRYIGKKAKYTGASLYWTFPLTEDTKPYEFSQFHYDLEDYASLRFCFYLTEVTLENGPHICIKGSHKKKPVLSIFNYFSRMYPEQALKKFYAYDQFRTLTGKAGFGFIEDVFCFHKGEIPKSQPRLFLQLHFTINDYGTQKYHDSRAPNTLKTIEVT